MKYSTRWIYIQQRYSVVYHVRLGQEDFLEMVNFHPLRLFSSEAGKKKNKDRVSRNGHPQTD